MYATNECIQHPNLSFQLGDHLTMTFATLVALATPNFDFSFIN